MDDEQNKIPTPKIKINVGHLVKLALILIVMMLTSLVALSSWLWYEEYRAEKSSEAQYEQYREAENRYVEAMTNDTYGGKTPQETLDLFVDALRKEDIELASKYFILDDETLDRKEWEDALVKAKEEGRLQEIVSVLEGAVPDEESLLDERDYKFASYRNDGELDAYINMRLNTLSGVWKIESI